MSASVLTNATYQIDGSNNQARETTTIGTHRKTKFSEPEEDKEEGIAGN